ncbi:MAG: ATP-binding protein [Hyphomicrobiales bacterium]|nr:ATP-binding protein [Hyphomicrobiales bacterium]
MADMDNSGGTGDGRQGWLGRLLAALAPGANGGMSADRRAADDQATSFGHISAIDLADVVPDPIVVFDRSGAVVHANQAAIAAFGAFRLGSSVQLKFRAPEMQALLGAVLGGEAGVAPIDYSERVPVDRLYRVAIRPVGTASGLFAMTFRDHSEARRIDRMRADFIANASHELRTPLAAIAGFIETLRGPAKNDAKARERFLGIMEEQTGRMARLIDDLLSLSRLEMKSHHNPSDRVDLAAVVGGVADTLTHLAGELGVAIERDFPGHPVFVAGERDELIQVFVNLLENACKYGQSGKRVIVSVEETTEGADVTVRDFGPGIPKDDIPRITERFYRVDIEASRAQKGTGLGLSIVKHILNRHGARLTVHSEPGKGASFVVHFPAAG